MDFNNIKHAINLLLDYQEAEIADSDRLLELATELHTFIEHSEYKPAYDGSILDIIGGISEPLTSQIIANILNFCDENKRFPILESFIKDMLGKNLDVENPKITAEKERLDVAIKDNNYVIVIENKLKNADFQRNQLARYIARMNRKYGGEYNENNIYIVIMPQFHDLNIRISAGRLPCDWHNSNNDRECRVGEFECWCDNPDYTYDDTNSAWCKKCDKDIFSRLTSNTVVLHDNFTEWLIRESENLPSNQWPLSSCMMQFAFYLKGLYYTRNTSKLDMDINKFLKERILSNSSAEDNWNSMNQAIEDLKQLTSSIQTLRIDYAKELVEQWKQSLQKEYPALRSDEKKGIKSFDLNIKGVRVGCWAGDNDKYNFSPYWGFYFEETLTEEQKEMVDKIVSACDVSVTGVNEDGFIYWGNTLNGDKRCQSFYRVAKDMGYL